MRQNRPIEGYRYTEEQKSIISQISKLNNAKLVLNATVSNDPDIYDDISPELDRLKNMLIEAMPEEPKEFGETVEVE